MKRLLLLLTLLGTLARPAPAQPAISSQYLPIPDNAVDSSRRDRPLATRAIVRPAAPPPAAPTHRAARPIIEAPASGPLPPRPVRTPWGLITACCLGGIVAGAAITWWGMRQRSKRLAADDEARIDTKYHAEMLSLSKEFKRLEEENQRLARRLDELSGNNART